jgi:hypothetical protein
VSLLHLLGKVDEMCEVERSAKAAVFVGSARRPCDGEEAACTCGQKTLAVMSDPT